MTLRHTGVHDADLNEILNFKFESGAALPGPFVAAWEGRAFFVTTPGASYGLWTGGAAAWERPTNAGGIFLAYAGTQPGDYATVYDALVAGAADANATDLWIFVRDSQTFSPLPGDQIVITGKNVHLCGLPYTVEGRPVLTFNNSASPAIRVQNGYLTTQSLRVSFTGVFGGLDSVLIDLRGAQDVWMWDTDLNGGALAVGSILGLGADGSDINHNIMVFAYGCNFAHAGTGQAIYHRTPPATKTNSLVVWSFGSVWGAQSLANGSTDGTVSQFITLHAMHATSVGVGNAVNSLGRKLAVVMLSADYSTYVAQDPSVTMTRLGVDTKISGSYAPVNYVVPPLPSVYEHLQGIDTKLGIGSPPLEVSVPTLGHYANIAAALAAIVAVPMPPPTHPAILVNYAEETNQASTVSPPLGGVRIAQEGRVIGGIAAVEPGPGTNPVDLFLHGNGKDNCVRSAVIVGNDAATRKMLSITCMGVRDDNFLVPGDVGSPYFPVGIQIVGKGLFDFHLHCAEIKRPIDLLGLDPTGFLALDWQCTKFDVPVAGLALKSGVSQAIIGCEFFGPVTFTGSDGLVPVSVDRCNFFVAPSVTDPNITLWVTDTWIAGYYYSSAKITSAGIVEGHIGVPLLTTAQKLAMAALLGSVVYDTTVNEPQYWNGGAWVSMTGGGGGLPLNIFAIPAVTDPSTVGYANDSTYWLTQSGYTVAAGPWTINATRVRIMGQDTYGTLVTMNPGTGLVVNGADVSLDHFSVTMNDLAAVEVLIANTATRAKLTDFRATGATLRTLQVDASDALIERCFLEQMAGGMPQRALYVSNSATHLKVFNNTFRAVGTGAGAYFLEVGGAYFHMESCKVIATGSSGMLVVSNLAPEPKILHNAFYGAASILGAIWCDADHAEIVDNQIESWIGAAITPGIQLGGLKFNLSGNRVIGGVGAVWAYVVNVGYGANKYGRIHGNYVGMNDVGGNVGFDLAGSMIGTVIGDNVVEPYSGAIFAAASPISTVAAIDYCTVVGNVFRGPIGGPGFGVNSQVLANVLV